MTIAEPTSPWWFFIVTPVAGYVIAYLSLATNTLMKLFYPAAMHVTKPRITYLYFSFLVKYLPPPFLTVGAWFWLAAYVIPDAAIWSR